MLLVPVGIVPAFIVLYPLWVCATKSKVRVAVCRPMDGPLCCHYGRESIRNQNRGGNVLSISQLNTYYRYFLIGYLCRRYAKFNSFLFKNDIVYAIGLILFFLQWRFCDIHNMALIFLGAMGAIIVLQRYFESKQDTDNWVLRTLTKIGSASLPIYVIHYFFIPDVSNQMHQLLDCSNPFIWQLTSAMLLSIPIIVASMFVGKLIEHNKYLNSIFWGKFDRRF